MKKELLFHIVNTLIVMMMFAACSNNINPHDTIPVQSDVEPIASQEDVVEHTLATIESAQLQTETIEPSQTEISEFVSTSTNIIYLYGEQHGFEKIMNKELELWRDYYHNEGLRHLFIEAPYYTAEFLNIWMGADNDDILVAIYNDWEGTSANNDYALNFYRKIKNECPETVFHGTDVGHQYDTTGERFLRYLKDNGMENSTQYTLTQEAIKQGKLYYKPKKLDDVYRENKMTENFIREFDALDNQNVMGIYGGAHTGLEAMDYNTQSVPCMANQLKEYYGDIIYTEDLGWLAVEDIAMYRIDTLNVGGKEYEASYFGQQDLTGFKDYKHREYWRLENAYGDFKDKPKTGDVLPYSNYPMLCETSQVFVIDYTMKDGSVTRKYYRSDGYMWNGAPSTEEFTME